MARPARDLAESCDVTKALTEFRPRLYCNIVACAHLGNGTGCRTATMAAPLVLTNGPVKCEVMLHGNFVSILCVCV